MMLLQPGPAFKSRQMLTVVTCALVAGTLLSGLIRLALGLSLRVSLDLAAIATPLLLLPWVWHFGRWPCVEWVEATTYPLMMVALQSVMEVNVSGVLLVIPVIGVLYRNRWLTLYTAAVSAAAFALMQVVVPDAVFSAVPPLQLGAHLVLQGALAAIFVGLISLAERAERSLVQAHLTEQMAMQWAASIEARDQYTGGHVERVTRYAMELAPLVPELKMDLELFRLACVLHDVGKISVPDQILNKPGPLTADEFGVMKQHPTMGSDLVLRTNVPAEVAAVVRHHHERWDGRGYPDGLAGEAIPLSARVLAVADAFDAMTTLRPYRTAMTVDMAYDEIHAAAGTQFDPAVVAAFDRVFDRWVAISVSDTAA